jgi:Dolichyl-phosphate-mannose-protein mannosyltransferase
MASVKADADSINRKTALICLAVVLLAGTFLRLPPALFSPKSALLYSLAAFHPNPKWHELGFVGPDEELYRDYVNQLSAIQLGHYPDIVLGYIEKQAAISGAILPPLRFLFIFAGFAWQSIFHSEALVSLRSVASLFSILTLGLTSVLAWRIRGPIWSVALTALVAFAPTQLHMSQHALVDGFFAFWAVLSLWLLWENLQSQREWRWLVGYATALAALVLTKETAFFVWVAIVVIIVANRWLRFGYVAPQLLTATILGPLVGVIILTILAGGVNALITAYHLFVTKNYSLPYQVRTGDGPWYRYLVDLLLVSPLVLILAVCALFRINRTKLAEIFLLVFLATTYAMMCNVKYGMNLRFVNMWDVPLRFLALSAIASLVAPLQRYRALAFGIIVAFVCAVELRQYQILFVDHSLYELDSAGLFRALNIVK